MTLSNKIRLMTPYLRVNNRQQNIDFYTQTLGFKLFHEENALSFLGGHRQETPSLVLEESPSVRTRAVSGPHKLACLAFRADSGEIAELLARKVSVQQVYRGDEGYAFSALSPEGHVLLLHGEQDLTSLVACDYPDLPASPDFVGLSQLTLTKLDLHVTEPDQLASFFADLPLSVGLIASQGEDLAVPAHETWDLESIECLVAADVNLAVLASQFSQLGAEIFLNKKETLLIVTLPNQLELWFMA